MKTWMVAVLVLVLVLSGTLGVYLWNKSHVKRAGATGAPICILAGDMKNLHQTSVNPAGFENLGNMVRLRFEANTREECQHAAANYCHARTMDGYAPGNVVVTFRLDPVAADAERFKLGAQCTLEDTSQESP